MSSPLKHATTRPDLESIDIEHREIIQLINDFDALLRQGGTAEQVVDLFAVVLSNIKSHFEEEEKIMLKDGYDGHEVHKAEHDRLLDELRETMKDCEHGDYADRHLTLARRITDWFESHLEKMDAPMIEFEHRQHAKN